MKKYRVLFNTIDAKDHNVIYGYGFSDYRFYLTAKLAQLFWVLSLIPGQFKTSVLEDIIDERY